ncbi:MAG: hypothetical protein AB1345_08925 [Chloroflexota bacterium]
MAWLLRELTRRQPELAQALHDERGVNPPTPPAPFSPREGGDSPPRIGEGLGLL